MPSPGSEGGLISYYADGSWGANQYNPFGAPGATGGFSGPLPANTFGSPFSGGGSDYYDSSGSNGNVGMEQFIQGQQGANANSSKYANWLRQRNPQIYNQFGAAQGQDPSLKWSQYLTNNQDSFQSQYMNQNPYDKGEQGQRKLSWL